METAFRFLLNALKVTGDYKDAYNFAYEELPAEQGNEFNAFFGWLQDNNYTVGSGNIEDMFLRFKSTVDEVRYPGFYITDRISPKELEKQKQDALDKIIHKGETLAIMKSLTSVICGVHEVVSVDKDNGTITIKLNSAYKIGD